MRGDCSKGRELNDCRRSISNKLIDFDSVAVPQIAESSPGFSWKANGTDSQRSISPVHTPSAASALQGRTLGLGFESLCNMLKTDSSSPWSPTKNGLKLQPFDEILATQSLKKNDSASKNGNAEEKIKPENTFDLPIFEPIIGAEETAPDESEIPQSRTPTFS